MCTCGCGESLGVAKLPGPDESIYFIEIHAGCEGCDIPSGGFLITWISAQERIASPRYDEVGELQLDGDMYGPGTGQWAFQFPSVPLALKAAFLSATKPIQED